MDSELLTPDEQLVRGKRWQGETTDLPTAIRNLAKVHGVANETVIDESESWYDFVDDLCKLIGYLGRKDA